MIHQWREAYIDKGLDLQCTCDNCKVTVLVSRFAASTTVEEELGEIFIHWYLLGRAHFEGFVPETCEEVRMRFLLL